MHDLRANTEYTGFTPSDPVIQWFWDAVEDMTQEQRAHLLQFVTGTSKVHTTACFCCLFVRACRVANQWCAQVPLDGFKSLQGMHGIQRFSIHKAYGGDDRLPSAHTWYASVLLCVLRCCFSVCCIAYMCRCSFNQLDLPEYSSRELLRQRLLFAVSEGNTGFGFG